MELSEELMSREEVQNAIGRFAIKAAAMEDQFGIMASAIKSINTTVLSLDQRETEHYQELQQFIQISKNNERIDASEVNQITNIIENRVGLLLREQNRMDLFGRFTSKCRKDCHKRSYMLGKNGVDTKKMYYSELINYIGKWEPHDWGTVGYIAHLDSLRKKDE